MGKQVYEVAYFIPSASKVFPSIRNLVRSIRTRFSVDELQETQLYGWVDHDRVGILLRFQFQTFLPSMLKHFAGWAEELSLEKEELESVGPKERKEMVDWYQSTADLSFVGNFDFSQALDEMEKRFHKMHGTRREPRVGANLRVRFKAAKGNEPSIASRLRVRLGDDRIFIQGYADSISSGGMFLRDRTDLPLRSRIQLVIELPEMARDVKAIAEIVDIVTEEKARLLEGEVVPGSGVRFLKFFEDGEMLLKDYLGNVSAPSPDLLLE